MWEAWTGHSWAECEVDRDDTGGLNGPGDVVLHVPATHAASIIGRRKAGWLRCRVVPPAERQPFYTVSPRIRGASAFTIGGTVPARYAEAIRDETVGLSEGVPGQRFPLTRRPVVDADDDVVVEVAGGGGWERWSRVEHFAESDEHDRHFVLDAAAGEIAFGPGVREPDGSVRQYGAVPPKAAPIRVPRYRTGGGRRGNVARGTVRSMRSSLPFVARIENRKPGVGGVDGESVDNAKRRAPLELRTRNRAVTLRDYEYLARAAARQVARVHCQTGADPGSAVVRVLLVPEAESDEAWRLEFEALQPDDEVLQRVAAYLDERRVLGTRLIVEPPRYRGVTVVAHLRGRPGADTNRVRTQALAALNQYLHPLVGGPERDGWPFGRPVQVGELNSVLQAVSGVELVDELRLYPADPITGERDMQVQRLDLPANALVYSFHHQIRVSSMSRRSVPALASPHPLGELLPGLYLDDDLVQRWTAGPRRGARPGVPDIGQPRCILRCPHRPRRLRRLARGMGGRRTRRALARVALPRGRRCRDNRPRTQRDRPCADRTRQALLRCRGAGRGERRHGLVQDPDTPPPGAADPHLTVTLPAADLEAIGHAQLVRAIDQVRPAHLPVQVRAG